MKKLLVFTDVHICAPGKKIIGIDPAVRLKSGLDHAIATHPDAQQIIIMGDLAHHGEPAEYVELKRLLSGIKIPVTLMLGNHDRRDKFLACFPESPQTAEGFAQSVVDLGDICLICLDTLDGPPSREKHHSGILCCDRLSWLNAELNKASDKPVLVFMHHPPFEIGFPGMDAIRLRNGDGFMTLITSHPNVRHIFAGHVHRTISGNVAGMPFSVFKSPCHQMPMLLSSDGSSHSSDEPGAYGIVLATPDATIVHTEDFDLARLASPAHDPTS